MLEWGIKLSQKPCQVLICHCLCFFAACEQDPWCRAFRDQPMLRGPWLAGRACSFGCVCLSHAFLAFWGGREPWAEVALGIFQLRCHCCGCYSPRREPRSNQDGGSPRQLFSTVSLLALNTVRMFSVLSDRAFGVGVGVSEPPFLIPAVSG